MIVYHFSWKMLRKAYKEAASFVGGSLTYASSTQNPNHKIYF